MEIQDSMTVLRVRFKELGVSTKEEKCYNIRGALVTTLVALVTILD